MSNEFNMISKPHLTEKVLYMYEDQNKVVFKIRKEINKIDLKRAIESVFGVTVESINTLNVKGKKKRLGKWEGRRPSWKKAIITLREGDSIEYFEGA